MPFRHPGDIMQNYRIKGFAAMLLAWSSAAFREVPQRWKQAAMSDLERRGRSAMLILNAVENELDARRNAQFVEDPQ